MSALILAACLLSAVSAEDNAAYSKDWYRLPATERQNYVWFYTSSAEPDARDETAATLKFAIPSASRAIALGDQIPVQITETLYRIDLGGLLWSYQDFNEVVDDYPYGPHGTRLFDARWFLSRLFNTTKSEAYYILIYGKKNVPKTGADFRRIWGEQKNTAFLQLGFINRGKGVSVSGLRDVTWFATALAEQVSETNDFFEIGKGKNPLQALLDPKKKKPDGKEQSASIYKRAAGVNCTAIVWMLANDQDKKINEANGKLVKGDDGNLAMFGHQVVITPGSCYSCHTAGLQPMGKDAYAAYIKEGGHIRAEYEEKRRIEQALDVGVGTLIDRANEDFALFVKTVNGLTPQQNAENCRKVFAAYNADLTFEQAAHQLYCSQTELKMAIGLAHARGYDREDPAFTQLSKVGIIERNQFEQLYCDFDKAVKALRN